MIVGKDLNSSHEEQRGAAAISYLLSNSWLLTLRLGDCFFRMVESNCSVRGGAWLWSMPFLAATLNPSFLSLSFSFLVDKMGKDNYFTNDYLSKELLIIFVV